MATESKVTAAPASLLEVRVNGKNWHPKRKAFRPTAGLTDWKRRAEHRKSEQAAKAMEKEMKDEKEAQRQKWIGNIKAKREAKAEKERYELMAAKMHQKRVDRVKRREKRNKLLNS